MGGTVRILLTILAALIALPIYAVERPNTVHEVFFKGTNYELDVYRVNGRKDGNTMLIIGGIQGDEPGGYLATDLYSDIVLEKGNLIIVPRANLYSVIENNRGIDGDMNRYFDETPNTIEGQVVKKLMQLIGESDLFLNMHDGWGYHNPKYIDETRNPERFGQSIIIDEDTYTCSDNTTLKLGDMAREVIENVNAKIDDERHYLHLFDTKTESSETHKPMRKSATWFALVDECVPAFGVEGSKNMNFTESALEKNIRYHAYSVNEFMRIMDIVPEYPQVVNAKPVMKSASFIVNENYVEVKAGEALIVEKGSTVSVVNVDSNYIRGVTVDVLGQGTLNDINKPFVMNTSTAVVFRKDNKIMDDIKINIKSAEASVPTELLNTSWLFTVELNGQSIDVRQDTTLDVKSGDTLKIISIHNYLGERDVAINFKGWYPLTNYYNEGDDRGHEITFPNKRLIPRYAVDGTSNVYPVVAGHDDMSDFAVFYVRIAE